MAPPAPPPYPPLMTTDQYTQLVAFIGRKFEDQERRTLVLLEQAANERRILAEGTDARVGKVEARLDGIDTRLDGMDGRLDTMNEGLGGRLTSIEGWIRAHQNE